MFEKLEFYLNLKNDFALTFLQDKHRVLFLFRKDPQNVNEAWDVEIFSHTRRHKSYCERESTNLAAFPFFSYFLFFVLCKMYEKSWVVLLVFMFNSFRFFGFFVQGVGVGGDKNLVIANLVNTVLNMCTLKCVLCLYRCKYSEKYKRYLKMIIKIYWSLLTIMSLSSWM